MNILVTGGAGYIGSHACVELQQQGHRVVIVDSLCNSDASVVERIGQITGTAPVFVQTDIRDRPRMATLMRQHAIDAVLHFAALKSVGESQKVPLQYFDSNISGTIALLGAMQDSGGRCWSSAPPPLCTATRSTARWPNPLQPVQ